MFWINQFCEVFSAALCDLVVSTFVFFSVVRVRWSESSILYCRGGKLRFKARKFDMLLQMFGTFVALLCTFGCVLLLKLYFRWVQFSPLLGRVREKWQCQSGVRENGIGSTHSMQPKSTQKCEGKTQFRFNHQCIGEKAVIDMLQN